MNIWYETLTKPPMTPPNTYFPIAWSVLYLLMFISFVIILKSKNSPTKLNAAIFFCIQLAFNLLWSYLFFDLHKMEFALVDVILILIFLVLTMKEFYKISKWACYLLIPYLLQVIFAIYLNTGFIILN